MQVIDQTMGLLALLTGEEMTASTALSDVDSLTVVEWMYAMEDELGLEVEMERLEELGPDDTLASVVAALVRS